MYNEKVDFLINTQIYKVMVFEMKRMFTTYFYKGKSDYLDTQKKYEIMRTSLYFLISLFLFAAGWITTGDRLNLLTVVAVLGCLPACKSTVGMIMFLKFKSISKTDAVQIEKNMEGLSGLYDMVFTSYDKNYQVDHLVLKDHTLCGYSSHEKTDSKLCQEHLGKMLLQSGHKGLSIKIFKDINKYTERLKQLQELGNDNPEFQTAVFETLKSISL